MTVEEAVVERLKADDDVAALVGTRVYQLKLPQAPTLPAVRVQLVTEPVDQHLRGGSLLRRALVQIDAFAAESSGSDPYATVVSIGEAIYAALTGPPFTDAGSPELRVTGARRESRTPMYESDELQQGRMLQEYVIWSRVMT